MWSDLPVAWQACWEEGWTAWQAGSLFIGAAVTDADGLVVGRGRNHIYDCDAPSFQVCSNQLAHAELNALLWLNPKPADVHSYHIYTLVEPCPLCMGAIYMSGVRCIHYAARDPYAGSTNLLGTTPYLSVKPVKVMHPDLPELETAVTAMQACNEVLRWQGRESVVAESMRKILPAAVALGERMAAEGLPTRWRLEGLSAAQVYDYFH
jgi:tRNA(adenine34) deaminase